MKYFTVIMQIKLRENNRGNAAVCVGSSSKNMFIYALKSPWDHLVKGKSNIVNKIKVRIEKSIICLHIPSGILLPYACVLCFNCHSSF